MPYLGYRGMSRQISAKALQERAAKAIDENPEFYPIILDGTKKTEIYKNWWGKAWCKNLERFGHVSHGENQIKHGEKYVINNAVVDLKIESGSITAHVIGDNSRLFEITVEVKPLSEEKINEVLKIATGKIQNIDVIINGDFPEDLAEILLPRPDEVDIISDCQDNDYICSHTAAVLYGIGVRIDNDPLLLFEIRSINADKFVWKVLSERVEKMLENADKYNDRILEGIDLVAKFGVDEADTKTFESPILEECPFCGHTDYEWFETEGLNGDKLYGAYCKYCGAGLPLESSMEDYARIWNQWKHTEVRHTNSSLRACPICGAFTIERYNKYKWFWHKCTECGCESGGAETRGEALKSWNRRHIPLDRTSLSSR